MNGANIFSPPRQRLGASVGEVGGASVVLAGSHSPRSLPIPLRAKLDAAIAQSNDPAQARTAVYRTRLGLGDDGLRLVSSAVWPRKSRRWPLSLSAMTSDALPALEALSACYMAMDAHPQRDELLLTAVERLYRLALDNKKIATLRGELHRLLMLAHDTSGQAQTNTILALRPLDKYASDWLNAGGRTAPPALRA